MSRFRLNSYLLFSVIATAIFILLNIDSMWSWSVDLAHHYALAFRISEHWTLLSNTDPTLGEMNIYPRGGHIIAAVIGAFVNSTFLGLQLTTLLSLSLLWLSAVYLIKIFPGPVGTAALSVALILFLINHSFLGFQLHGHEVIGNFFFSQLVAHAFLYFCLILAISVEKKEGTLSACVLLAPLMLIVATIHLLPALELLGMIVGLIVTFFCFDRKNTRSCLSRYSIAAFILILAVSGIIMHPSLSAMRAISENNGALELNNISYPVGLVSICLLVLASSTILFVQWLKKRSDTGYLAAKYLAIYGLVAVGLCLTQYVLTYFGKGSDYAVKKYGFGLITILFMQLSVSISILVVGVKRFNLHNFGSDRSNLNLFLLFCLSLALLFFNTPAVKSLDVSDLVSLEKKLVNRVDLYIPYSKDGNPAAVIGLDGLPSTVNYMFSIAIAKTPRALAIPDILMKNGISQPNDYGYIISTSFNKAYGSIGCVSLASGDISVVNARCLADRLVSASMCGSFDFTSDGLIPETLLSGFSSAESHGRWTDGSSASFQCTSSGTRFKTATIELTPFIYGVLRSQRLQLIVSGKEVYNGDLSEGNGVGNPLVVDLIDIPSSDNYVFTFKTPDATSPKEVGFNEDTRKLGISLRRISFN
jgi:hypothetical protein